jgi:predicted transcriptional regulator
MAETTTILIRQETKARLDELKRHPRETYNDVVDRLASMATDDETLSEETLKRIEDALEDLKQGRYYTEEEIEAELELG